MTVESLSDVSGSSATQGATSKACTGCGEVKAGSGFGVNRAQSDGLQSKCRECIRARKEALKLRYAANSTPTTKTCRSCKETLPAGRFNASSYLPDRLQAVCKACASAAHRLAKYDISPIQYAEMLARQGGQCMICRIPECSSGRAFAVDHDHACCPGKKTCGRCVRALLCWRCNHTLGILREDIDVYRSAIAYIESIKS